MLRFEEKRFLWPNKKMNVLLNAQHNLTNGLIKIVKSFKKYKNLHFSY